ncbi:MFS transporter [Rufibacter immobilis]|uniref:MFS transporter n=1 Tax=Rufibacter immobilis TaxID=1348778 RepID=UPI0035EF8A86
MMQTKLKQRIALGVLFFQSGLCFSSWASRIPDIKNSFLFSDSEFGTLLLIRPLGSLLGLPLAGWVVDRYGSKYSAAIGILGFSVSLVLLGIVPAVAWLAVSLLLFGLSSNLTSISINAQALAVQESYGRTIMSSFHGLWSLAGFCGASVGAAAISLGLERVTHFLLIMGTVFLFVFLSLPHLNTDQEKIGKRLSFAKPDPQLLRLGLIAFCGMLCEGCMLDWSGVYFKQVLHAEQGWVTAGFMAYMGSMAAGRFVSDRFANRYGSTRMIQVNGLLICSGLLLAVIVPSFPMAILGFILVGAGTSSVIPLTYTQVGKNQTLSTGLALALVSTIGYFGFLLGPPLIGFIADWLSLRVSFTVVALVGISITLLVSLGAQQNPLKPALPTQR